MTRKTANPRATARVVPLRKGTTLQMVRLACPDTAQCTLIAESFGLPILDSDGIRDLHEKLLVDTAASLSEGLGERAMQIHLQRIVGAFVGSASGARIRSNEREFPSTGRLPMSRATAPWPS
ncbi:hypothetical protein FHS67_004954 [Aminobacter aminovorans]|uniref:ArgG n=1 Tax=Aminobacter aminovorans TaxID=83263 RepID=A0AAC9ATU8_AMIAI|nr:ArgG [Aminobacter aminovorans]MBB3708614.1 hypothetical protein [Aminobacter aminovorans]